MKFVKTVQDLGEMRTVALPAAHWELIRRATGSAGFNLPPEVQDAVFDAASTAMLARLPVLTGELREAAREDAKSYLLGCTRQEKYEIQVGDTINSAWVVEGTHADWVVARNQGTVLVFLAGDIRTVTEKPQLTWPWPKGTKVRPSPGGDYSTGFHAHGMIAWMGSDGTEVPPLVDATGRTICYVDEDDVELAE